MQMTYELSKIGNLFSEDALYYYSPFDEDNPVRGRAAIVASWLEAPNAPDSCEAHYAPVAVEGTVTAWGERTRTSSDRSVFVIYERATNRAICDIVCMDCLAAEFQVREV